MLKTNIHDHRVYRIKLDELRRLVETLCREVVVVAEGFIIGAQIIGRCEGSQGENGLIIDSGYGKFTYP